MAKPQKNIAGIILAAGEGKRAGKNKALLSLGGRSFLEIIAQSLADCGCDPIIGVIGAQAEDVRKSSENLRIQLVINENWRQGQFSSLRKGISTIDTDPTDPSDAPGAFVCLVDHPLVTMEVYHLLSHVFYENPEKIIIPIYGRRRGHPVVIPNLLFEEILEASDEFTLSDIIRAHREIILEQLVDDPGILKDIDSESDFKSI